MRVKARYDQQQKKVSNYATSVAKFSLPVVFGTKPHRDYCKLLINFREQSLILCVTLFRCTPIGMLAIDPA